MTHLQQLMKMAKSMHLLYVEDDTSLQDEMTMLLSDFFGNVTLAQDGQEALELYRYGAYDLVVTDIRMPRMDGIELIEAIKKINMHQTIIVTSAHNEIDYLTQLIDLGVDSFITKPLDSDQVIETLYRCVCHIHDAKSLAEHQAKLKELNTSLQEEVSRQNVALRENYAKMEAYQHAFTKVGYVMVLDSQGMIKEVNHHLATLMGYIQLELKGKPGTTLFHASTPKDAAKKYAQCLASRTAWSGEVVFHTKALQPLHVNLMLTPVFLGEETVEFLVILQDLSASNQAIEEKSRALEVCQHQQLFSKILYNLPLPAFVIDTKGCIGAHNLEFIEMIEEGIETGMMRRLTGGSLYLSDMLLAEEDQLKPPSQWFQDPKGVTILAEYETILGKTPVHVKVKALDEESALVVLCYKGVEDDSL